MAGTIYVDSAGNAGRTDPKSVNREVLRKISERAKATRASAQAQPAAPAAPVVNDTIANPPGPGRLQRAVTGIRSGVQAARGKLNAAGPLKSGIAARALAVGSGLMAPVEGAMQDDSTARYATRFGVQEPTGDGSVGDVAKFTALRIGGAATDMASGMTGGLAGRFYRDANMPAAQPTPAPAVPAAVPVAAAASQPPPMSAPPNMAPATTPVAAPGMIAARRAGVMQDGPASFTDGRAPALPSAPMSDQNQQAFDNMGARGAAETAAYMALQNQSSDINYGDLGAGVANLKQLGFNRAERLKILDGAGLTGNEAERGLIARARQAEVAGLETKNRGAAIENDQAGRVNDVVTRLLELNDQNDPGAVQRTQIHQSLRALGVNKSGLEETPEEKYLRDVTKAAYSGMVPPEQAQQMVEQAMRAYRNGGAAPAPAPVPGGDVSVDPTQGQPQAGAAQFEEGKVYVDASGNRAKYQNGQWVEV